MERDFPEVLVDRNLHLFTDLWNGKETSPLTPEDILDPRRMKNASIRALHGNLLILYKPKPSCHHNTLEKPPSSNRK